VYSTPCCCCCCGGGGGGGVVVFQEFMNCGCVIFLG
jgi:hypothetical protein